MATVAPSEPTTEQKSKPKCGHQRVEPDRARKHPRRDDGDLACRQPAGWGTSHPGFGRCKFHGGDAPSGIKAAERQRAQAIAVGSGKQPFDALQEALDRAQGLVEYFDARIADLTSDEIVADGKLHAELRHWRDAFHDLAQLARISIDAGLAERRTRVLELLGDELARAIGGILADLKLTEEQETRAPAIVERHLILLEGGRQAEVLAA